jgi:hypothetical protein
MNILEKRSLVTKRNRRATANKAGLAPFRRFLVFVWKLLFLAVIGYGIYLASPFLKYWFTSVTTAIK